MEAPEKIWVTAYYSQNRSEQVQAWSEHGFEDKQQHEYTRADLSQASVAAALEVAAALLKDEADKRLSKQVEAGRGAFNGIAAMHGQVSAALVALTKSIRTLITQRDHDALAAHVAAEVAKARAEDAAKLTKWCDSIQADVLGCIDLSANEEANAVLWINNFRAEIAKIGGA